MKKFMVSNTKKQCSHDDGKNKIQTAQNQANPNDPKIDFTLKKVTRDVERQTD